MGAARTILGMVSNLMYTVKIRETAAKLGAIVIFVASNEELAEKIREIHPSLLIFDLTAVKPGWQEIVRAAKAERIPVIAYGPHVDKEALEEAAAAGCDFVYPNSRFTLELPDLLEKALSTA
ncbi:type 1 periplasmic-binding domain-containing protein [Effusibacillus pohliae]|uniref:hypothetical protein n=1 Tax=Effusibacillus pohliae TaxID=232270 RepID=UPI00037D9565|nr:hypothetical protein [Effusibacillus pohliae]